MYRISFSENISSFPTNPTNPTFPINPTFPLPPDLTCPCRSLLRFPVLRPLLLALCPLPFALRSPSHFSILIVFVLQQSIFKLANIFFGNFIFNTQFFGCLQVGLPVEPARQGFIKFLFKTFQLIV